MYIFKFPQVCSCFGIFKCRSVPTSSDVFVLYVFPFSQVLFALAALVILVRFISNLASGPNPLSNHYYCEPSRWFKTEASTMFWVVTGFITVSMSFHSFCRVFLISQQFNTLFTCLTAFLDEKYPKK